MSTTDEVIGSIDHALRDFETGPDAMRWAPESAADGWRIAPVVWPPTPSLDALARASQAFGQVMVTIAADVGRFVEAIGKAMADISGAFWVPPGSQKSDRLRQMHSAYHQRARRRTRSRR